MKYLFLWKKIWLWLNPVRLQEVWRLKINQAFSWRSWWHLKGWLKFIACKEIGRLKSAQVRSCRWIMCVCVHRALISGPWCNEHHEMDNKHGFICTYCIMYSIKQQSCVQKGSCQVLLIYRISYISIYVLLDHVC